VIWRSRVKSLAPAVVGEQPQESLISFGVRGPVVSISQAESSRGVREHLGFSGFFIFSGAVNKGCGSKIN
jgi:hypothetical protein